MALHVISIFDKVKKVKPWNNAELSEASLSASKSETRQDWPVYQYAFPPQTAVLE